MSKFNIVHSREFSAYGYEGFCFKYEFSHEDQRFGISVNFNYYGLVLKDNYDAEYRLEYFIPE